jgi:hypothetical protein
MTAIRHVPLRGCRVSVCRPEPCDCATPKRELGWTLRYPSWRQGFFTVYASPRSVAGHGRELREVAQARGR